MMTKTKKQTGVKSKNPVECGGKGNAIITLNPDDEFLFYQTQFENTVEFIMRRYRRKYADAFGMFAETNLFEDFEDEEEPGDFREGYLTMFHDWLIHTRGLVKSGFTGIDLYLEREKKLTLSEREMLGMMNDSVMTLFEVRVSRSRDKLVFNDLLLNYGRIEQPSPEMVDPLEKSVMGARVVHFSHGPALGIGYIPFMHDMKTLLLETLREYFADYKKAVPTATMETFLKNENPVVGLFLEIMRALKVAEEEVENDESEVTFNISIFDVIDYRAAKKSIQKLPRLREWQKDTFEWYSDDSEDPELLGTVLIVDGEMILAAVSEEMREAGKLMLRSACRTSIRHREDSIRTVSPDEM